MVYLNHERAKPGDRDPPPRFPPPEFLLFIECFLQSPRFFDGGEFADCICGGQTFYYCIGRYLVIQRVLVFFHKAIEFLSVFLQTIILTESSTSFGSYFPGWLLLQMSRLWTLPGKLSSSGCQQNRRGPGSAGLFLRPAFALAYFCGWCGTCGCLFPPGAFSSSV